jgi:hypothetical protein
LNEDWIKYRMVRSCHLLAVAGAGNHRWLSPDIKMGMIVLKLYISKKGTDKEIKENPLSFFGAQGVINSLSRSQYI